MIKLSKIKIFKRTVLSVLSLTLLLGGAFFAAKMVKTFHVNAAEGGEEVGAGANKVYVTIDTEHGTGENGEIYYGSGDGEYPHFTTRYYSVTYTGTGGKTYLAYCVEPLLDVPSTGQSNLYDVSELAEPGSTDTNFNAIKLLIYLSNTAIAGQTNPVNSLEIMNTLYDGYGSYDRPEEADIRYAFVHATAGFLYPSQYGGEAALVGLDDTEKAKVREIANTLKAAVANNATGNLYNAWLIAQNSTLNTIETDTQHMVWIEPELQSGKIKIIKCDADNPNKCSGDKFKGTKFTIKNISGHRIYVPGAEGDNKFFDNGQVITTVTINDDTGQILVEGLPLGVKYRIEEISTSEYYYKPTDHLIKDITLTKNGATVEAKFNNKRASLDTTATDAEDGDKFVQAGTKTYIKDVVEYCVVPGQTYTVTGVLMDKTTGKPLLIGGKQVTGVPVTFTPTESCGTVEMIFELDSSELGGKDLVVFESLSLDNELITSHEEIDDPDQTIRVVSLGTTATDASDGDKTIIADGEATINDRIKYCLVAGKEYTIIGTLMNKSTREPIKSNNEVVSKSITITPEEDCGEVDMEFKFDTTGLGGTDVVVFEKALILNSTTDDYDTIASHEDLDDEGQTIKIVDKAPETGMFTGSASSTTGGINILVLAAAGVSVIGVGGYLVTRATAKKRFMSRR